MSDTAVPARIAVRKTYKLYIGGQFPRTESGRAYEVFDARGRLLANEVEGEELRKHLRLEAIIPHFPIRTIAVRGLPSCLNSAARSFSSTPPPTFASRLSASRFARLMRSCIRTHMPTIFWASMICAR